MKKSNANQHLIYAVMTGLFAAIITVLTAYVLHIPVGNGYVHMGDSFIFVAACLLPTPYAIAAGAIGAGLADALSGAPIWIPASIIIKSLITICFTSKSKKIISTRNIVAIIIAMIITCTGYYVYEGFIYGNWTAPLVGIVPNIIQVVANGVVFIVVGLALDAAGFKSKVLKSSR
ncbi:MAG: TIGR04002 family protein [Oscillospiraceae bacterium]|nr:TIGR04002 family protein [Oscillospiraceae bacterium]